MIKISKLFKLTVVLLIVMAICLAFNKSYAETLPEQPIITDSSPLDQSYSFNPNATCGDFLRDFDPAAPEYFKYDRCIVDDKGQVRPITVIYKIDGQYAKQAEQYVMTQFHSKALIFLCCYWATDGGWPSGSFLSPKEHTRHYVGFYSEETFSSTDWQDLHFYLTIEVGREEV